MPVLRGILQLPAQVAAIRVCQFVVQQDQVRHKIPHRIKQLAAQSNIKHFELLIDERLGNDLENRPVVV